MAVTLSDAAKAAMIDALGALLDGGQMVFQTAGNATVSTITFNADAFSAAVAGDGEVAADLVVEPALEDSDCAGNAAADVARCLLQTSAGVTLVTLGVGTANAEVILSHVRLLAGDLLRITSGQLYM